MNAQSHPGEARWWQILAVVVVAAALTGSVVEIFHGTESDVSEARAWERPRAAQELPLEAPAAPTYEELRQQRQGPNAAWTSHLSQLQGEAPAPALIEAGARADAKSLTLTERAETRAYAGAPPVVPHVIDQQVTSSCVACHGEGLEVAGRVAPVLSHPVYANCTQCHVPSANDKVPESTLEVANAWVGAQPAGQGGARAWPGAPPVIPHPTVMRESCASCHGVWGKPGLRTTHPERQSCTQCHAPDARLDQRAAALFGGL